jgi:serine/threonine-protein kinase HipA
MSSEQEALFIWVYLPDATNPVVAGRLDVSQTVAGSVGSFVYGKSYLDRQNAIPLDPVTLPLNSKEYTFTTLKGFPGVVLDACPDRWGKLVIDRLYGTQIDPEGYLLLNDPGRVGALVFSRSSNEPPIELSSREFPLEDMLVAARAVEAGEEVAPELLRAFHPGTGGARPKCNVVDQDGVWIAKFPSIKDPEWVSVPRLEHATMLLGQKCGINTARTRLEVIDGKDVCLVKRFDREIRDGQVVRHGYVSARSIFYSDQNFAKYGVESYGRLSTWMTRYGCQSDEREQLFRRMVFNCAVRNSDDHDLNHGLVHVNSTQYRLAEAFDVLPVLTPHAIHQHALVIGDTAAGTVSNLLSNVSAFGLLRGQANEIVNEVQNLVKTHWQDTLYEAGLGDEEIRRLEPFFQEIPTGQIDR